MELELQINSYTPADGTVGGCFTVSAPEIALFQEQYAYEDDGDASPATYRDQATPGGDVCKPAVQSTLQASLHTSPVVPDTRTAGTKAQAKVSGSSTCTDKPLSTCAMPSKQVSFGSDVVP